MTFSRLSRDESVELAAAAEELRQATSALIRSEHEWDVDFRQVETDHDNAWARIRVAVQPLLDREGFNDFAP